MTAGVPSAYMRPLRASGDNPVALRPADAVLHPPFSGVRYDLGYRGVVQLSLYGGTNSFEAEEAYLALRNCVDNKQTLDGLGKDAFYVIYKEALPVALKPTASPNGIPFRDLAVEGRANPDTLDPAVQLAQKAPTFRDLPTPRTNLKSSHSDLIPAGKPKEYKSSTPEYLVLVAYMPDKALTLEIDLDKRMGDIQSLITLGVAITRRIALPDT